jgi:hypothetical protein
VLPVVVLTMIGVAMADSASAQLGALVSPGRLNRAHLALEGVSHCLSCHTAGQQVSATKCLTCHKPVADRIARKVGVHRAVTTDCVTCHVEHAGSDGELRPFDQRGFNHATEAAFPLDGQHAAIGRDCAACHKTRSFLGVTSSCGSCHTDAHKGTLGAQCARCHSTAVKFAETRTQFDHSRTAFALTGAHLRAACSSCHVEKTFKHVRFASCANCHTDVHASRFGPGCNTCHSTTTWRTTRIDHARTAFPLKGRHAAVQCAKCHVAPSTKVRPGAATCAACHVDPHRGTFKQDCAACHNEAGFKGTRFDHAATRFPLVDKHAPVPCAGCHKSTSVGTARAASGSRAATSTPGSALDYRGLARACQSCHTDVHRGELGATCEACHSARTFAVTAFTHAKDRAFFRGAHTSVTCAACHTATFAVPSRTSSPAARVGFVAAPVACASCHRDVHLGQVGATCETCHDVGVVKFGLANFTHRAAKFPLSGRHEQVQCAGCHRVETRAFPAGHGEARVLTGLGTTCVSRHTDVHRKELPQTCEQCHTTKRFAIPQYEHRNAKTLRSFFAGAHGAAGCASCHKPTPTGLSSAPLPSFRASTTCTSCHTDVHRGALGPKCEACHRW